VIETVAVVWSESFRTRACAVSVPSVMLSFGVPTSIQPLSLFAAAATGLATAFVLAGAAAGAVCAGRTGTLGDVDDTADVNGLVTAPANARTQKMIHGTTIRYPRMSPQTA
jgi:hypothetical protein